MNRLSITIPLLAWKPFSFLVLALLLPMLVFRVSARVAIRRFAEDVMFFTHKAIAERDEERELLQ